MLPPAPEVPNRVVFPLLENGLDFLASAVEHLRGDLTQRDLKYALLHLASGVELVLKERLRLHEPAQLYQNPETFDAADFATGDFQSANVSQTVKRLVDLVGASISDADRTQLHLLRDKRNRVEHFGLDDTAEAVSAVTARMLAFALDFIAAELDTATLSPRATAELRGIREALPALRRFVTERWQRITVEIRTTGTAVVECPGCGEAAAVLGGGVRCHFCGYAADAEQGADEYAHTVLGASHYQAVRDGVEWVVSQCPDCESETLVDRRAVGGNRWVCFDCGLEWNERSLWSCDICGAWTSAGEGELSVCDECFQQRVLSSD